MRDEYIEPARETSVEVKISKARFIGRVIIAKSAEDARASLRQVSELHKQATHNCWAYRIGSAGSEEYYSDDGEPTGTAGKPILGAILKKELVNTLVVVTRYFGGIKLGVRGLIEAYASTASMALDAAGTIERIPVRSYRIRLVYDEMGLISRLTGSFGVSEDDLEFIFTEDVLLTCKLPLADAEKFEQALDEMLHTSRIMEWKAISDD